MSKQGSVSGVKRWLEDQPSDYEPLDIIGEDDEDEDKDEDEEQHKSLFDAGDTEIIKKIWF